LGRELDPFSRALEALRERLRGGDFVLGEPLPISDLARELDLSATPVREALSRLAGEGLIEDRRGRGYFSWRVDPLDLVELYDLNQLQVGAALTVLEGAEASGIRVEQPRDALLTDPERWKVDLARAGERLFAAIVRAGGGRTLVASQASLADRLGPARRIEPMVLTGMEEEFGALVALYDARKWRALAIEIGGYHQRRRAAAGHIVTLIRRQGE
jgi:DNA-binding GntR family transcriptional regulator